MWGRSQLWYHYQKSCMSSWFQNAPWLKHKQKQKVQKLLPYLFNHIPFYREYRGMPFEKLPIIDKELLLNSFDSFNVFQDFLENIAKKQDGKLHIQQSMGTVGGPVSFIFSQEEILQATGKILSKFGKFKPNHKLAIFHGSSQSYFPVQKKLFQWKIFNLQQQALAEYVDLLEFYQPDIIIAPTHTLVEIAHFAYWGKIRLSPKKLIASSELSFLDERTITSVFKQPVNQLYQCALGWLGTTCEFGTMHLNEDMFLIEKEWIDDRQKQFIPIITAFNRFTQPVVRYQLDDILTKKKECLCKSIFTPIESITRLSENSSVLCQNAGSVLNNRFF